MMIKFIGDESQFELDRNMGHTRVGHVISHRDEHNDDLDIQEPAIGKPLDGF